MEAIPSSMLWSTPNCRPTSLHLPGILAATSFMSVLSSGSLSKPAGQSLGSVSNKKIYCASFCDNVTVNYYTGGPSKIMFEWNHKTLAMNHEPTIACEPHVSNCYKGLVAATVGILLEYLTYPDYIPLIHYWILTDALALLYQVTELRLKAVSDCNVSRPPPSFSILQAMKSWRGLKTRLTLDCDDMRSWVL